VTVARGYRGRAPKDSLSGGGRLAPINWENRTRCPWCGSLKAPVPTDVGVAVFQYESSDSVAAGEAVRRNPIMCPDCFGVGASGDWGA
jgi:hypothetical protein